MRKFYSKCVDCFKCMSGTLTCRLEKILFTDIGEKIQHDFSVGGFKRSYHMRISE